MKYKILFLICLMLGTTLRMAAQDDETHPENRDVDRDSPTFEPMVKDKLSLGRYNFRSKTLNRGSKTLNVGSKTLNGHSTTMNGDFNRAKKEVFPKKATTFLRNTSFYTQMRCLSIPLYKAPESSSDPQPSEHFYPNEPYHHLPYAR